MFGARAIKRRRAKEEELKALRANGPPPVFERSGPSAVKGGSKKNANGKKGMKKGKKESYDLIVNINLEDWKLTHEQVAELKEVFMLFDRDEDGVLSFQELQLVMKSMGQRPSEESLLESVREVSEDYIYDTLEFNEFLQMMSKQQENEHTRTDLMSAFRIFDEDDDGCIHAGDLVDVLTTFGEKLTKSEAKKLVQTADKREGGLIDYEAFSNNLLPQTQKEVEAEAAAAVAAKQKEEEEKEKLETKLCW